ncbi:MAG TPA: hypothetical protein VE777_14585 [Gaiellales bacterium]|jgi:hypothetical protein|nr:hypothetical protein [Gaiellales bacterium]
MSTISDTMTVDVVGWRERRLETAGFDEPLAALLACDCAFDLHRLIMLVEAGCPPHLAVRILAPIDQTPRPC